MLYDSLKHPFEDIRMDWKTLWKSGLLKRLPEQEVQDAIHDPKIPYWIWSSAARSQTSRNRFSVSYIYFEPL